MTEDEWWVSDNVDAMLKGLRKFRQQVTPRKLRLLACGCARRIERLLVDERLRWGLTVADRHADETADGEELKAARKGVRAAWKHLCAEEKAVESDWQKVQTVADPEAMRVTGAAYHAARAALIASAAMLDVVAPRLSLRQNVMPTVRAAVAARDSAIQAAYLSGQEETAEQSGSVAYRAERCAQSDMTRDLFGFLFHQPLLDSDWLKWNRGLVRRLAQAIYDESAFERMPILGDALEDAGCQNPSLLAHCREPFGHIRGCWLVDLILSKNCSERSEGMK